MNEAALLDLGGLSANSESFTAKSNFFVQIVGSIAANVSFTVEQLPQQESTDWTEALGENFTNAKIAAINYAFGFKYRIKKSTSGTQTNSLKFYIGNTTSLPYSNA